MSQLRIQLEKPVPFYKPGEILRAVAGWHLDAPQTRIEARLCWFSGGQVVPESRIVETIALEEPALDDKRPVSFQLPAAPYSFHGAMTMLGWAVEIVALPSNQSARVIFHLSPTGSSVNLFPADELDESDGL